jgi:hypothetical protein
VKVLVTGSRSWANRKAIQRELSKLPREGTIIVHGACETGADKIADEEAQKLGFEVRPYPADWDAYRDSPNPRAAGPARNSQILREEHSDKNGIPIAFGLAFTEDIKRSRGTSDMVTKANKAGIRMTILTG